MSNRQWAVTVHVDGVHVLTLESSSLCGVENVSDYREEILAAADHLISFIGREETFWEEPPESVDPVGE